MGKLGKRKTMKYLKTDQVWVDLYGINSRVPKSLGHYILWIMKRVKRSERLRLQAWALRATEARIKELEG